MKRSLFLLFNHQVTKDQEEDARQSLGASVIADMPGDLKTLWRRVPPEIEGIYDFLEPFREWLDREAKAGDFVLVQGDFGACWHMVGHAFDRGLVPVYSTTDREAKEEYGKDGTIRTIHLFRHKQFRRYGE